ncbi:hypothetical protein D046_0199B, partial [Vibrio parahaemolyticus V-223/04]
GHLYHAILWCGRG